MQNLLHKQWKKEPKVLVPDTPKIQDKVVPFQIMQFVILDAQMIQAVEW